MPASENQDDERGRPHTLIFWGGIALAPLAALLVLLGSGTGALRFAAILAILAVVLVGISIVMRPDAGSVRADLEETLFEELDGLRADVRRDITTAARATHKSFTDKMRGLHEHLESLRGQVDVARGQLDAMRSAMEQRESAPAAAGSRAGRSEPASAGRPVGTAMVGGVVRHTETVQVTTRQTIVDPGEDRRDRSYDTDSRYGRRAAEQTGAAQARRDDERRDRHAEGGPAERGRHGERAAPREESWTEQRLRDRLRDTGSHLFGDPGRFTAASSGHSAGAGLSTGTGHSAGSGYAGASGGRAAGSATGAVPGPAPSSGAGYSSYSGAGRSGAAGYSAAGHSGAGHSRSDRSGAAGYSGGTDHSRGYSAAAAGATGAASGGYRSGSADGYQTSGGPRGAGDRGAPQPWDSGGSGYDDYRRGARSHEPDDSGDIAGDPHWSGLRAGDRWASVRSDDRGRELRMGERRAALHRDETGTEVRIEDRWAAVLRAEQQRGETRRERREREESWSSGDDRGGWSGGRHGTRPALPSSDGYGPTWSQWQAESGGGHREPERESRWQREELPRPVSPRPRGMDFELTDDRWR
jgi:hypothetical protein